MTALEGVTLVLGDLRQPAASIAAALGGLTTRGVLAHDWDVKDAADLAARNLAIERRGPGAVPRDAGLEGVLAGHTAEITMIATHFTPVDGALIERLPALRYVATLRAGTEHIDTDAAAGRGIVVINNPGRNANAVAEFTLGLLLAQLRGIEAGGGELRAGRWLGTEARVGFAELSGRVVGLVGFGQVGRRLAELLGGFGCQIVIHDPYLPVDLPSNVRVATLDEVLRTADVISLHARLTPETKGLIGREALASMRPTAILVNTARAELVDETALVDALRTGRLAGAAIDVFAIEPLPREHPLRGLPNVTLTPHLAGTTVEAHTMAALRLAARIEAVVAERSSPEARRASGPADGLA